TPGPQWVGVPARPPEGWVLGNAVAESLENDTWNLRLTGPMATVQPPPPIELKVLHAPFLQLRWRARGLRDAQPSIEWQVEGQTEFSVDQRMYFEPVESDAVVYTMVPMFRHPKWTGRITALRVNFGNPAPGGKVGLQAFFAQYDTRHTVNNQNMIK